MTAPVSASISLTLGMQINFSKRELVSSGQFILLMRGWAETHLVSEEPPN